jgi:hypothetical protein
VVDGAGADGNLLQNAADAIAAVPRAEGEGGRISLRLEAVAGKAGR